MTNQLPISDLDALNDAERRVNTTRAEADAAVRVWMQLRAAAERRVGDEFDLDAQLSTRAGAQANAIGSCPSVARGRMSRRGASPRAGFTAL